MNNKDLLMWKSVYEEHGFEDTARRMIETVEKNLNEKGKTRIMYCAGASTSLYILSNFLRIPGCVFSDRDLIKIINVLDLTKGYLVQALNKEGNINE